MRSAAGPAAATGGWSASPGPVRGAATASGSRAGSASESYASAPTGPGSWPPTRRATARGPSRWASGSCAAEQRSRKCRAVVHGRGLEVVQLHEGNAEVVRYSGHGVLLGAAPARVDGQGLHACMLRPHAVRARLHPSPHGHDARDAAEVDLREVASRQVIGADAATAARTGRGVGLLEQILWTAESPALGAQHPLRPHDGEVRRTEPAFGGTGAEDPPVAKAHHGPGGRDLPGARQLLAHKLTIDDRVAVWLQP